MTSYGIDTNVLVYWEMMDLPEHRPVEAFLEREVYTGDHQLAVAPLVLYEFVHIVTDPRRFPVPLEMSEAIARAEQIWRASEVRQLHESEGVLPAALDLMRIHGLGRKRILDTVLAAILRVHAVPRLLTANEGHFAQFSFLEV
ncbi:MAG: TA system VapC family ribonuclease toxin, partial [Polyangiales bacterium]